MVWGPELRQKEESEGIVTYTLLIGGHGTGIRAQTEGRE